jgi:hypothetical protein
MIYPGFKSAFSDVIGYFYVSSSANKILTELLLNKDLENSLDTSTNSSSTDSSIPVSSVITGSLEPTDGDKVPSAPILQQGGALGKKELEKAADAIVKICGNNSILINQMVPDNFSDYWKILNPLKKPEFQDESNPRTLEIKNELFELVTIRDNIGEAMWYIYTGLLLVSITQMKIASRGCVNSPATMEKNYKQFLENEKQAQEAKANSTQTYTIT